MEDFIESVRQYPCLWATTSEEYKIKDIKDAAWRNVIKECDLPDIKEAKNLWKKLRDGHRQSLNRKKITTGQAADNNKNWKYERTMEFLLPYMANRQRSTNVSEQLGSPQSQSTIADFDIDIKLESGPSNFEDSQSSSDGENKTKKRRPNECMFLEEERKVSNNVVERDPLRRQVIGQGQKDVMKSFFETMYEMSRGLPERVQMKIQRDVFNSVMQAREENTSNSFTSL